MPSNTSSCILTLNGGSSSIRCAVYAITDTALATPRLLMHGKVERINHANPTFVYRNDSNDQGSQVVRGTTLSEVVIELLQWLEAQPYFSNIVAIGHRVVYGASHATPQHITPQLLTELQQFAALDPEHLPFELELVTTIQQRYPALPQVACFDTSFHRTMPMIAKTLPLPIRYQSAAVERNGFHGLSYCYLLEELRRLDDHSASNGRIIMAHLGSGASLAALRNGVCIDTSMGFTPASGIMMSTRSGDIDPGLLYYMCHNQGMTIEQLQHMLNHECGLLGVSGTSADVRDLLTVEQTDSRAATALAMFCYQIKKCIGAYAAALEGVDTLVFTGGIGENSPQIRQRVCDGLRFLGITIDTPHNDQNNAIVSTAGSTVTVRVIHTNEELMIAKYTSRLLDLNDRRISNV